VTRRVRSGDIQKMLLLLNFFTARRGERASFDELCEKLGLTHDELQYLLNIIHMCGLPDYTPYDLFLVEQDGRYVSIKFTEYFKEPVQLTDREAVALVLAAELFRNTPLGQSESFERAIARIESVLPDELADVVEGLRKRVKLDISMPIEEPLRAVIERAINERETLNLSYYSRGRHELSERTVDPLVFIYRERKWYLLARDHRDGKVKSFIVERIRDAKPTGKRFEVSARTLSALESENIWLNWRASRANRVVLRYRGEAARLVVDLVEQKRVTWLDDETLEVEFFATDFDWVLTDLILPYAGSVTIVEPTELKERLREEIRRIRELYASGTAD
jgi:proteasome accessory factor C